ncbi:MAG: phospholipase [Actinomycetota bacterium]|nr:phospholipase [Actinomycetota bacterium]
MSADPRRLSRRWLLRVALGALAGACEARELGDRLRDPMIRPSQEAGRLQARPGRTGSTPQPPGAGPEGAGLGGPNPGLHPLGLGERRDGLIYVPAAVQPDRPRPLVIALHGAGGDARGGLAPLLPFADPAGLLLLAPESRERTWDLMAGGIGPDVAFIDRALTQTFARHLVDPERIAIEGFSDGASYALSLGLANGDLIGHVIAFSPGFSAPPQRRGQPRLFVSHGTHDQVLPIAATSRKIVAALNRSGYEVVYREFEGSHAVPPEIAHAAVDWFLARPA